MRIGVTGATGGVGKVLVREARARGIDVRALVRDATRAEPLAARGAVLVRGDLDDRDALEATARGCDAFVHAAAHVGDLGTRAEFEHVNVEGTRHALEAVARAGVKRFVHVSSVAVYGRPSQGTIDEAYAPRPFGAPYEDTKYEAEKLAFARGRELGLEVVALRPPLIIGPDDRVFMPRAIRALRRRMAPLIDGGGAQLNVVRVEDLVDVLLRACARPEAVGEAFNVAANPPPTVREVFDAIADAIGAPRPRVSLPYGVAMPLASAVDAIWRAARIAAPPPINPFIVTFFSRRVVYDARKAREVLGWDGGGDVLRAVREAATQIAARG